MTTVFHITLRPILILSKCIGLIDITYTVEPNGLLVPNIKSMFHIFLEKIRFIVLLIITYTYIYQFHSELHLLQIICVVKFWTTIIAARLTNNWIIEFINGMIEFDRKLTPISTSLLIQHRSLKKKYWDVFFILLFAYYIGVTYLHMLIKPLKTVNIASLTQYLFLPPFILDYIVTSSLCFFLQNLHARFCMLNDFWKYLPTELIVVLDQWTHTEIVFFMEKTRLLHSELCEVLKKFTLGYGPSLLAFFTFSVSSLLIGLFFIISINPLIGKSSAEYFGDQILAFIMQAQIVIFMMSIIIYVSFIDEQRTKIISYLRLYKISKLRMDIKQQIKMFMNQMSISESEHITAFGFFNIDLNLVLSILVLIITGIITLIQMKHHPIMLKLNNDTNSYIENVFKN